MASKPIVAEHAEREPRRRDPRLEIGQWCHVKEEDGSTWLGCVTQIGSNFVNLRSQTRGNGWCSIRVHLDELDMYLTHEPNASAIIRSRIADLQAHIRSCITQVQTLCANLGINPQLALAQSADPTSLTVIAGQSRIDAYKAALIRAKTEELPSLMAEIKKSNEALAGWMTAETIPLEAMANQLKGTLDEVGGRIFNVELYAGLTEDIVCCREGAPASANERLRIMQRRLYMDEECLLGYRHGGMEFKDIHRFDEWLSEPDNLERILPFPRCMVAMRVRRLKKDREYDGSLMSAMVNFDLGELDRLTFLYVRNGERVYRLNCSLEFDELIFPDKAMFDPDEPRMVRMFAGKVDRMITVREYESLLAEYTERESKSKAWEAANPREVWEAANPKKTWWFANPYRNDHSFRPSDWKPFDASNVYYDEAAKSIADRIAQYNRVALIIQGLYDRSDVLQPHPPVQTWTPEGFAAAIELIYDGSAVLGYGEPPDFEAYRARCNATLGAGSVTIGQDYAWQAREAERETRRLDNDWRNRSDWRPKLWKPYGDPGPGYIAKIAKFQPRARKAVFEWERDRRSQDAYGDNTPVRATLTVSVDDLFNVDAYQLGDYKQFFRDPRTRAEYLQWAPMLLAAEEYHAARLARDVEPAAAVDRKPAP